MTKFNKKGNFLRRFDFAFDLIKESKIKLIILSVFILIAFFTGLIVAIKTNANYVDLDRLGVVCVSRGGIIGSSFFARLFSMLFVALICFGCSFSKFLFPFSILLLSYRGYLLGINICLIISVNGFAGIIVALLIALPCQIVALAVMVLLYIMMAKTNKDYKNYCGYKVANQRLKLIVFAISLLLIICLIEALLIAIFSPSVILVI